MKFKNIITGTVLEVSSDFVVEQMKKSEIYEEVKPISVKEEKKEVKKTSEK